jgi:hypothetical protein
MRGAWKVNLVTGIVKLFDGELISVIRTLPRRRSYSNTTVKMANTSNKISSLSVSECARHFIGSTELEFMGGNVAVNGNLVKQTRPTVSAAPSLNVRIDGSSHGEPPSIAAQSVLRASPPSQTAIPSCQLIHTAITAGTSRVAHAPLCLHAVANTPAGPMEFCSLVRFHQLRPSP